MNLFSMKLCSDYNYFYIKLYYQHFLILGLKILHRHLFVNHPTNFQTFQNHFNLQHFYHHPTQEVHLFILLKFIKAYSFFSYHNISIFPLLFKQASTFGFAKLIDSFLLFIYKLVIILSVFSNHPVLMTLSFKLVDQCYYLSL